VIVSGETFGCIKSAFDLYLQNNWFGDLILLQPEILDAYA